MPATRIETGVWIELSRLKVPPDARKHHPEKIETLAKSIKEDNAQLQDILVCPQDEARGAGSPSFDVLAGVGRKEAAEKIGWEKVRCTVLYGLSPYEKLKVTLDENKEREDISPLDEALIYRSMLQSEPGLKQEELAKRVGMSQPRLNDYLAVSKLDTRVQRFIRNLINLKLDHLVQICRLEKPEDQISIAQEADSKGLTIPQVKALVRGRFRTKGEIRTKATSPSDQKDPYAEFWPDIHEKVQAQCDESWAVVYTTFTFRRVKEPGWAFGLVNRDEEVTPQRMAAWLKRLAEEIEKGHLPDPVAKRKKAQDAQDRKVIQEMERLQALRMKALAARQVPQSRETQEAPVKS
jgi:ParB/RepB/Spo0J family partition protein